MPNPLYSEPTDIFNVVKPHDDVRPDGPRLVDGTPLYGPDGLLVPQARSFATIVNSVTRTYSYRFDEAMRDNFVNARAMRRDAFVRSLLEERILPTINREFTLEVDDDRDPEQQHVRDGLLRILRSIKNFDAMKRALLDAVWFGRAGAQWTFGRDEEIDNLWSIAKWDPLHGDSVQFTFDGVPAILLDGMTAGWYTQNGATRGPWGDIRNTDRGGMALVLQRPYWRERFAIHQHILEKADFFEGEMAGSVQGLGIRGLVYWHYVIRTDALTWMLAYMQAVGMMDLLVFNYPAGNYEAEQRQLQNAQQVIGKAAIACPRTPGGNWPAVEQIPMNSAGLAALQKLVADYFDRHIERLIVGQSMSSGADHGTGLGGTGRADFARQTKDEIIVYDTNRLDQTMTHDLVRVLKKYNYPWARFPVRFKSVMPDVKAQEKVNSGRMLVSVGVPIKADEFREAAGYSRPEAGDDTVGSPQPGPSGPGAGPPMLAHRGREPLRYMGFGGGGNTYIPGGGGYGGGNPDAGVPGRGRYAPARYNLNEQRGFEESINSDPLNAATHLAFADWLREHGDHEAADFRQAFGEWLGGMGTNVTQLHPGEDPRLAGWHGNPRPWGFNTGEIAPMGSVIPRSHIGAFWNDPGDLPAWMADTPHEDLPATRSTRRPDIPFGTRLNPDGSGRRLAWADFRDMENRFLVEWLARRHPDRDYGGWYARGRTPVQYASNDPTPPWAFPLIDRLRFLTDSDLIGITIRINAFTQEILINVDPWSNTGVAANLIQIAQRCVGANRVTVGTGPGTYIPQGYGWVNLYATLKTPVRYANLPDLFDTPEPPPPPSILEPGPLESTFPEPAPAPEPEPPPVVRPTMPELSPIPSREERRRQISPPLAVDYTTPHTFAESVALAMGYHGQDEEDALQRAQAGLQMASSLSESALTHLAEGRLRNIVSHPNADSVLLAWRELGGDPTAEPEGFYDPESGTAAVNGVDPAGVLAHEIAHGFDWNNGFFAISTSPEFKRAWWAELAGGLLTDYAAHNSIEGFAEIGRLLWATPDGLRVAQRMFPRCLAVFAKYGLV